MKWFTSDHHFGHENIMKYCPRHRQFETLHEMNVQLVAHWNEMIAPDDEVIAVGDVIASRKMSSETGSHIMKMLHGKKTLVRGNHDPKDHVFLDGGFIECVDHLWLEEDKILVIHRPPDLIRGKHEFDIARKLKPDMIIHGHDHRDDTPENQACFNVCVDRHALFPVPFDTVMQRLITARQERGIWHGVSTSQSHPKQKDNG